jgi:hypothetical protein
MQQSIEWRRTVTIETLDASGRHAAGAELQIAAGNATFAVTVGSTAIRLEFEDPTLTLEVTASFWGEIARAVLPPDIHQHNFRFRAVLRGVYAGPGTARCPDGTAGQPCVDCNINGSIVRICA